MTEVKPTEIRKIDREQSLKIRQQNSVSYVKDMVASGKLKFVNGGEVALHSSGYICDVSNDTCLCAGDASSEDCQAMFENICPRDSDGNPIYTCLPGGCTCSIGSGAGGVGGISNEPLEVVTPF